MKVLTYTTTAKKYCLQRISIKTTLRRKKTKKINLVSNYAKLNLSRPFSNPQLFLIVRNYSFQYEKWLFLGAIHGKLQVFYKKIIYKKMSFKIAKSLTLSRRRPLSYRNQSIDLLRNSMDWFLYDNGLRHERFNYRPVYD